LNGIWRLVGLSGLSRSRLHTLEVRGRRTGRPVSFPVMVADNDGERYLVSMVGEQANLGGERSGGLGTGRAPPREA
jgi:hypothetical protein